MGSLKRGNFVLERSTSIAVLLSVLRRLCKLSLHQANSLLVFALRATKFFLQCVDREVHGSVIRE